MDGLVWDDHPSLRRPLMVAAFKGWNDAGNAASDAASWLLRNGNARRIAWIDPEEHIDFQSSRPQVELVDGVTRALNWPSTECYAVSLPDSPRDLVVAIGVEPNYRWRSFVRAILQVAEETGATMLVTLGALLADVPHSMSPSVTAATVDPSLMEQFGLAPSTYEGPTGIVGVLLDLSRLRDLPAVSLWVPVPHYLAGPPHPLATRALLGDLARVADLRLDLDPLQQAGDEWRARVDAAIADDESAADYVRELEARIGEEGSLPDGDDLVAELERFLREQDD